MKALSSDSASTLMLCPCCLPRSGLRQGQVGEDSRRFLMLIALPSLTAPLCSQKTQVDEFSSCFIVPSWSLHLTASALKSSFSFRTQCCISREVSSGKGRLSRKKTPGQGRGIALGLLWRSRKLGGGGEFPNKNL